MSMVRNPRNWLSMTFKGANQATTGLRSRRRVESGRALFKLKVSESPKVIKGLPTESVIRKSSGYLFPRLLGPAIAIWNSKVQASSTAEFNFPTERTPSTSISRHSAGGRAHPNFMYMARFLRVLVRSYNSSLFYVAS